MKYLKYLGMQALYIFCNSFIIWGVNMSGAWGETFIDRFKWTYFDIFLFVVCINIAISPIKLGDIK